jgi:signal transduction histidine kinase
VTNSREAMIAAGGGSLIRVDVDADHREVRLRVRDDGPGIPDHVGRRLFERGFSTKGSRDRGTGLAGLREAARSAGGDLRFERGTNGAAFVLALRRA